MRLAGRGEGARDLGLTLEVELEAQLRADIKAQFAVISMALDERFDRQQAYCRSVVTDTIALVNKTFDDIEVRLARIPAIPAFPVPAAAAPCQVVVSEHERGPYPSSRYHAGAGRRPIEAG